MNRKKGLKKEAKVLYVSFVRSLFLCFVAFFAIVTATVAWFVNNSIVNSNGVSISHQQDKIVLATKGSREPKEKELIRSEDGYELSDGNSVTINNETYYYTDSGEIALRLESNETVVSPGAKGEITFYVIPEKTGAQSVNLHMILSGFEEYEEGGVVKGGRINDELLNSLISGHILLFDKKENEQFMHRLTGNPTENGVEYNLSAFNSNAQKDDPWSITVYWVWPLRYENMKKDFNSLLDFDSFIEDQASNLINAKNSYRYSQIFLTKESTLESAEKRSRAYNMADEYIGRKSDYLYVSIQTDLVN